MIKIYISSSCSSCRKVKEWFEKEKIPCQLKSIFNMTHDDVKEILMKSLDGTDEIISTRSKIVKEGKLNTDTMTLDELIDFIVKNPTVLKRPIIVDDKKIQVGYDAEEIRSFIPKARRYYNHTCSKEGCPDYPNCPNRRETLKLHRKKS